MKIRFFSLISLLLAFACLVSAFSVFAYAAEPLATPSEGEDGDEQEAEDPISLLLYRSFDEGWELGNGLPVVSGKDGNFHLDYEESDVSEYNYYWAVSTQGVLDVFSTLKGVTGQQYVTFQMDIKAKDFCNTGYMYTRVNSGSTAPRFQLYKISQGVLYLPQAETYVANSAACNLSAGALQDEWLHVAYCFNFSDIEMQRQLTAARNDETYLAAKKELERATAALESATSGADKAKAQKDYKAALTAYNANESKQLIDSLDEDAFGTATVTIYYGAASTFDLDDETTYTKYTTVWERQSSQVSFGMNSFEWFRIGFNTAAAGRDDTYCLDNVALYTGSETPRSTESVAALGCGSYVNSAAAKTVKIRSSGTSEASDSEIVAQALVMKNGVKYALINEERTALLSNEAGVAYGAPQVVDGKVMVPLEPLLDYVGYPVYVHSDLLSYDIATGKGASYITVGLDTASVNGKRIELTAAPRMLTDENTGLPYAAICLDDVETVFSGYYVTYDEMGLIIICKKGDVYNRNTDLSTMVGLMKQFVFDNPTGQQIYDAVKENTNGFRHPYMLADQTVFDGLHDVYTADQEAEDFNANYYYYAKRAADVAAAYYGYFATLDQEGHYAGLQPNLYKYNLDYLNECYQKLYHKDYNPNTNNDTFYSNTHLLYNIYETRFGGTNYGYDPDGGRNNISTTTAEWLLWLALGYQVTRNEEYAEMAYDIAYQLGTWQTWGEGHFLNCADTAAPYAQAFDWCYNVWKEFGEAGKKSKTFGVVYDVDCIAQRLYDLGISKGYISAFGTFSISRIINGKQSVTGYFCEKTNNWNAVCSSGITCAILATMEYYDDEGTVLTVNQESLNSVTKNSLKTVKAQALALIEKVLLQLNLNGLDEYAPDGGYIESTGYWSYGTNNFFEMAMALLSAAGDDFGFMDCWGIDTTCNYACQTEYPSGSVGSLATWGYHDSGSGSQDKSAFYFVGNYFGDDGLIGIRKQQIDNRTVKPDVFDILNYKPEYEETIDVNNVSLDLDYWGQGIDLFCTRSDWNDGCIYTGFMGGTNACSHNNIDAGTFIYVNKNYEWFCELGKDNYNIYNYFDTSNWRNTYYRIGGEGQNHVIVTSQSTAIPYGQLADGTGEIETVFTDDLGGYATMDLTSCYGTSIVSYAKRGLLFTNDRSTVVIQDEIAFNGVESYAWIAHTKASKIVLSADKTVAYLLQTVNGKQVIIRAAIVSNTASAYTFEIRDCYDGYYEKGSTASVRTYVKNGMTIRSDYLLESTVDTLDPNADNSLAHCKVDEIDRTGIYRLVVSRTGVSCEMAVVIEEVDRIDTDMAIGYQFRPLSEWETGPSADPEEENVNKLAPLAQWISTYGDSAYNEFEKSRAFANRYRDFFSDMHMTALAVNIYFNTPTAINNFRKNAPSIFDSYQNYLKALEAQQKFVKEMNAQAAVVYDLTDALSGFAL